MNFKHKSFIFIYGLFFGNGGGGDSNQMDLMLLNSPLLETLPEKSLTVSWSWRPRGLASYCISSWMIHGTVSGLHRASLVSAVSASGSPGSNSTLHVALAEEAHSGTRINASIHNMHMYRHLHTRRKKDSVYSLCHAFNPTMYCSS